MEKKYQGPKWEYCVVDLMGRSGFASSKIIAYFLEEDDVKKIDVPAKGEKAFEIDAWRFIASLGVQGWELVERGMDRYYFKRLITD